MVGAPPYVDVAMVWRTLAISVLCAEGGGAWEGVERGGPELWEMREVGLVVVLRRARCFYGSAVVGSWRIEGEWCLSRGVVRLSVGVCGGSSRRGERRGGIPVVGPGFTYGGRSEFRAEGFP